MAALFKKKVLVTGSTGFIGSHVINEFINLGYQVIGVSHSASSPHLKKDINGFTDWTDIIKDIDIVIHCAAVTRQTKLSESVLKSYEDVNFRGTINLAEQAKDSVRRFIFLSTIKVNGEETTKNKFLADDAVKPLDPFAISKKCAEVKLKEISASSKMELVIIRPPLVYGVNQKSNLNRIAKYLDKKIPLPFGSITSNSRSLIYVGNLVDFIHTCAEHKAAINQTFLISDDYDMSTTNIIHKIGNALQLKPILIPIPTPVLKMLFRVIGAHDYEVKLLGNLSVDLKKNKNLLNWKPKFSVDEAFNNSFKKTS